MKKIEVDTKLFITCRLCLSELGRYQIDPSVRDQIKFCYDIDVAPFDRLPQLICLECEKLLTHFHATKKLFQEKQASLKLRVKIDLQDNTTNPISIAVEKENSFAEPEQSQPASSAHPEQTQQETVTSSQSSDIIVKERKKPKSKKRIKENNTSVNKDLEHTPINKEPENTPINKEPEATPNEKKKIVLRIKKPLPNILAFLGPNFIQQYTCKICDKHFDTQSEIVKHCKKHDDFISRHKKVFKTPCSVVMNKVDGCANLTGSMHTVVLTKNKILQNSDGHYYISYQSKQSDSIDSDDDEIRVKKKHRKIKPILDDSSDDDFSPFGNNKKRQRLNSRSSTDTVVLDENDSKSAINAEQGNDIKPVIDKKTENLITECINIEDSSDNDSVHSSKMSSVKSYSNDKPIVLEYKTIQNIISICHDKYMKKLDSPEIDNIITLKTKSPANFESSLKHKILSIGRKIINKLSFNCNGLLRFLDHKNLDISWKRAKPSEENNHVRILTQMIEPSKKTVTLDKNESWKTITTKVTTSSEKLPEEAKLPEETEQINKSDINEPPELPLNKSIVSSSQMEKTIPLNITDGAVLYLNSDSETMVLNKLLNKTPVANPKRLPKKSTSSAQSSELSAANKIKGSPLLAQQRGNENLCMPVITHTTSLAGTEIAEAPAASTSQRNDTVSSTPRIKVKPVSELMPDKIVINLGQRHPVGVPSSVWNTGHADAVSISPLPVIRETVQPTTQTIQMPVRVTAETIPQRDFTDRDMLLTNDNESLILNTVELPNTKTNCPFTYFKNLLQLHSVVLFHSIEPLSKDFSCLIKFKVHFTNGGSSIFPVILSCTLMCDKNVFCMKIRDSNRKDIILSALSAKWQWQILMMFKGEVADKLLDNAAKVGRDTHYHAKIFISMLKSIQVLNYTNF